MSTDKVRVAVRVRPFNRRGMFTNKSAVVCIPCQKRVNYFNIKTKPTLTNKPATI